jgi:AraC-like DNA-binding protein
VNLDRAEATARLVRISTEDWPERDRAERFREVYGRGGIRVEPLPGEPVRIEAALVRWPDLALLWGRRSPLRSDFTDGHDRLILTVGGPAVARQFGREILLEQGDAIALSGSDRGVLTTLRTGRIATLEFPRGGLFPLLDDARRCFARRIPGRSPTLRLLRAYIRAVHANGSLDAPQLHRLAIPHVYDLAAVAVGAGRDAAQIAEGHGVRAARLQAIKDDIVANLSHELSEGEVAARHRLSSRYVRMLFATGGTSFSQFVREERLTRARSMLVSPRFRDRRISDIAYEVGFNDLSYFNRSFRRRFGCSPGELRDDSTYERVRL